MFKYIQYVMIIMVGSLLEGCGSKVTPLQDTTPAPAEDVDYQDDGNDYDDGDDYDDDRDELAEGEGDEAGHDPALGQPAPPAFSEANPCQTSANYLCVITPMYWNIRVLGPQLVQLPFERNLDTAQEYRIHARFTPTRAIFRVRNTQQIPGVAGFYHAMYYGYPYQIGQRLIASTSPVMTHLNNVVASYGRFPRQHQHVDLGIARRKDNESRCDYKAIFYHHSQGNPVAYVSGTGDCEFNNY